MTDITDALPKAHRRPSAPERTPTRGDIWFVSTQSADADLGRARAVGREIWSNKLAVVISNDVMNSTSGVCQVVYLTTSGNKSPSDIHVAVTLHPSVGADSLCAVALCEQVHTVDQSRLTEYRGRIHPDQLAEIEECVMWSLGIEEE